MEINYLAVLVTAFIPMVLGALWYSPVGFGNTWIKLTKWTPEEIKKAKNDKAAMNKAYGLGFVGALVRSYVLYYMLQMLEVSSWQAGAMSAFWIWLGFVAVAQWSMTLWGKNKSFQLFSINTGYELVTLILMGAVLGAWMM